MKSNLQKKDTSSKQTLQRPQTASQVLGNSSALKDRMNADEEVELSEEQMRERQIYDQEFQNFENYRSYLLQYQFLNATLSDKMDKQQKNLEIQFTDRLQQLKEMIDQNVELQTKILRERAINALEEVLNIEYKNYKEIFSKLDDFSEYAQNLQEFLNGSVKKVYLDSGFSINIDSVNTYIEESSQLIEKILDKHDDFFKEYPLIASSLSEIIQETMVQIRAIKQIKAFLSEIEEEQNLKIEEKAKEEFFKSKGLGLDTLLTYNNKQPANQQNLKPQDENEDQEESEYSHEDQKEQDETD